MLGLALCGALAWPAAAATYKWVDEQGRTHFSDSVPPEQTRMKHFRLDAQGRQLEVIEGAKSPETLQREKQLKHLREETERLLEEQRNRDTALLRTYGSEAEMQLALNDQLVQIDASERILEKYRERHSDILATLEKRAADMERQGRAVPESVPKAIEDERLLIAEYEAEIRTLEDKKHIIAADFTRDMMRLRSLKAEQERARHGSLGEVFADGADAGAPSTVVCATETICAQVWAAARAYVLGKAETPVVMDTARLVHTATPLSDQEIALTLARIVGPAEDTVFLDIRCRQSSLGRELCTGLRAQDLRAGFKSGIEAGMSPTP